jgi:hypothetical protein
MDVLELKQNRLVPRREDAKPKTVDEIRDELSKERLETELSLQEDIIKHFGLVLNVYTKKQRKTPLDLMK